MSIKDEIERIGNNVSDALAATAEMGATVPDGANSDNLGTLIRSIPTGGGGLPPLRIYAAKNGSSYRQEIIEGGATKTYTAAEIHELVSQRVVVLETYTSRDDIKGHGCHQYYATSFNTNGTVNQVHFRGTYTNDQYNLVPSYVSVDSGGSIFVSGEKWAGSSVETDASLTKSNYPANAKKVGDKIAELSEQIADIGSGGGTQPDWNAKEGEAGHILNRTHWTEVGTATIMPETTIEINPDEGIAELPVDFLFEANKPYTVKYNGVEYADCVGVDSGTGVALGNMGVLDESFPFTDHPFVLMTGEVDIDGDENPDKIMAIFCLDGSESVTLSIETEAEIVHKINGKFLPDGVPYTEPFDDVIMSEFPALESGFFTAPVGKVVKGYVYKVNWGGSIYECVAKGVPDSEPENLYLGNLAKESNTAYDTGEPFCIVFLHPAAVVEYGFTGAILSDELPENNEFSVTGYLKTNKISDYCLPDIAKTIVVDVSNPNTDKQLRAENMTYKELVNIISSEPCNMVYLRMRYSGIMKIYAFNIRFFNTTDDHFSFVWQDFENGSYEEIKWYEDDTITWAKKDNNIILVSPDGMKHRVAVKDDGTLYTLGTA